MKSFISKTVHGLILVAFLAMNTIGILPVYAASLTNMSDTLSSVKVSALSNHDIVFTTPTGITTGQTITVTFPAGFSMDASLTFTDVDVLVGGVQQTLAAANGAATWGVVRTSATVLTITAQSAGTPAAASSVVRIKIGTNASNQSTGVYQVTNASGTGQHAIAIGGTMADTGTISVTLLTDDVVAVTATVAQSISFAISANAIAFGTLDSAAARYANTGTGSASDTVAHTLAVGTNAPSGYTVMVQGATLASSQNPANTITAIGGTPATSSTGTEQFGIYATKSGGTNGTIASPYATTSSFGYDATAATAATFASGTTATATETYSLHYLANIAAVTEAGSYSTNLTYVATANF